MVESPFESVLSFLKANVDVIVLSDSNNQAKVAVVPAYQGRVMTSTVGGKDAPSFGWINREVIAKGFLSPQEIKGTLQEHIYVFGGEDRFWLGPEGGQFSVFFEPDEPFDFEHWNTPPLIDTEEFDLVEKEEQYCTFKRSASIKNYSGTVFDFDIQRKVQLLNNNTIAMKLNSKISDDIQIVGYETVNTITNTGKQAWQKETGLLSIWILGMLKHSPGTTVVIPFEEGSVGQLGPKVKDDYFGKVPADRLIVEDDVLFFKADGKYRSKIGISPLRAKSFCGSYDADNNVLTIVWYNKPKGVIDYVNSAWEMQDAPYKGDVVNSYNDGPPAPGKAPLGPFYELESSSPAAALSPGKSITHIHSTIHLTGSHQQLDEIAKSVLGASLDKADSTPKCN